MGGALTWVEWVRCLRGWRASVRFVDGLLACVAWVGLVAC